MKIINYLKYFLRIYALIGVIYLVIYFIESVFTGGSGLGEIFSRALFPTLAVGTGLALMQIFSVKELRKGKIKKGDLEVERSREMVIEADEDELFEILETELLRKKWNPKQLNRMAGYQEWTTPWWDDPQSRIKVYFENLAPGHIKISLTSRPRYEVNFVDKGKNIKNLDKIEAIIMAHIEDLPGGSEFSPNLDLN